MMDIKTFRAIFREWQDISNQIDVLKPKAWLETENSRKLKRIAGKISKLKKQQIKSLSKGTRKRDLEEFFEHHRQNNPSSTEELQIFAPELRENYRWFAHTVYPPKNEALRFQKMAAKVESKWAIFDALKDKKGAEFAWKKQAQQLEKSFGMRRKMAEPVAQALGIKPSEVTLDFWNPHFRNEHIDAWIKELEDKGVKDLIKKHYASAENSTQENMIELPDMSAHTEAVHNLFTAVRNQMLEAAGWTKERLKKEGVTLPDIAFVANGFCWGDPTQITMGVEFRDGNFASGFSNLIHETGHLLYMLSRHETPQIIQNTPLGHINGYSAHEFAAMSLEQTALKKEFMPILESLVAKYIPEVVYDENGKIDPAWAAENLTKVFSQQNNTETEWGSSEICLAPSMVYRALAERKIMDGELSVQDLPRFWAQTMTEWTGKPHDAKDFSLDESHWFDDNAGYFWAYQFGAMAGSAMYESVQKQQQNLQAKAISGDETPETNMRNYFKPYIGFLNKHLYQKHCALTPYEIAQSITNGGSLVDSYKNYIRGLVTASNKDLSPANTSSPRQTGPISAQ